MRASSLITCDVPIRPFSDVNPRDYRAWYGLGQTYELLTMYRYALHYYRKAVKLRPGDHRMWFALGNCYKALHHTDDAIAAFERSVSQSDEVRTRCHGPRRMDVRDE